MRKGACCCSKLAMRQGSGVSNLDILEDTVIVGICEDVVDSIRVQCRGKASVDCTEGALGLGDLQERGLLEQFRRRPRVIRIGRLGVVYTFQNLLFFRLGLEHLVYTNTAILSITTYMKHKNKPNSNM
jgi:hypothetical protein